MAKIRRVPTKKVVDRITKIKKALSRVIEYELKRPGEFGRWLADLHIEHWVAYGDGSKHRTKDAV